MIGTIARVIRAEGIPSALRRASERSDEALHEWLRRVRGIATHTAQSTILNVSASSIATKLGGVQIQLRTRLRAESHLRAVALFSPGLLTLSAPKAHARRLPSAFEAGLREAMAITGARTVQFDGLADLPVEAALRLAGDGITIIVSNHDDSLFLAPADAAPRLLTAARAAIFPSRFLLESHRQHFSLPQLEGVIIEPGVAGGGPPPANSRARTSIAFAGSVKRHKGGHLLPELARLVDGIELHVFGGGDADLLRAIRRVPNITSHGYYRSGALPTLLARHGIGMLVLPSVVPESFSLVLSEAWLAGLPVAAFDLGAQAERIRRHGGGWLTPPERGAAGLAEIVEEWRAGRIRSTAPEHVPSALDAAGAHIDLYRNLGLL